MTYVLGSSQTVGRYAITIISEQTIAAQIAKRGAFCRCGKHPAFVLVQDGATTKALDMMGARVPLDRVTALCPAATELLT
ncbi:hypothetical protein [Yoonia sediminilitoris]|uniref:Uncharacterized protein n=1 Tax=Yoonia sediminilitoris TaxID=1286148 RepID=A0A2T6KMN6_9RHOB|nr:hypothetical protein [Yoonia sediminilitoris]PUB17478.1 hypothetical protein C8N45_102490 [Yoonia sediminilitoris]RCW97773.1 hypothetical protein DFP92_102490 [Yoonia sediminilitoris]